ncbi:hypothetical protein [Paenibacillus wulumuqiensis]|nr:hypothetical protein [Paenibacillus wulumuqiensis]
MMPQTIHTAIEGMAMNRLLADYDRVNHTGRASRRPADKAAGVAAR